MKILIILCFAVATASAQEPDPPSDPQDVVQDLLESESEASEDDGNVDRIEDLLRNPLHLNRASRSELESVPGMPFWLVDGILRARDSVAFASVRDLLRVTGMNRELLVRVQDFLTVDPDDAAKKYSVELRQRTKRNVELTPNQRLVYPGNPYQLYSRLWMRYQPKPVGRPNRYLQAAWVTDKDPGETAINDQRSFYAMASDLPGISKVLVGHYQLEFGQGLAMGGASGLSKSSEVIEPVKKRSRGIVPYHSTSENAAFFGSAATLAPIARTEVTLFSSRTRFDASTNPDGTVNSILLDGYHRTESEQSRKNELREKMAGFHISTPYGRHRIGATYYRAWYDRQFVIDDSIRNRYRFSGQVNQVGALSLDLRWAQSNLFGEVARDRSGDWAALAGWRNDWERGDFVLVARRYDRDYQNLHAYGFGEQSGNTQNEQGIYAGIRVTPLRWWTVQTYYDVYRFPWRTVDVPGPVRGDDFLIENRVRLWRNFECLARIKQERKDDALTVQDELGRDVRIIEPRTTRRIRLQAEQNLEGRVRLRTRWEQVETGFPHANSPHTRGSLIHEDLKWKISRRITAYGRISLFDTDDFSSAIYEYESDVEGVFANTALYGRGVRWYVMGVYRIEKRAEIACKVWQIVRDDLSNIGTGGDQLSGNVLTKWTIALRLAL